MDRSHADEGLFDSAGVPIRFIERGAGAPVVLVHSFAGNFEDQFVATGVADALARHHRTIGFDLRGHGGSAKPHDPALYGREMALDVVRLLDRLAIARAHVVGYSLGAHLVAQLLTLHEERFITATLGGATGRRHWSRADDARVEFEAAEIERGSLRTQLRRLACESAALDDTQIEALSAQYLRGNDRYALAAVRRSNRDQAVEDEALARVRVPVLGIVGSLDPYRAQFAQLQAIMPALKLVTLHGATHADAVAHPGFVRALIDFVDHHSETVATWTARR